MLPSLLGEKQRKHDYLYWEFSEKGGAQAIRKGNFKAIKRNVSRNPNVEIELYNLADDLAERKNIAVEYPDIVQDMKKLFAQARTDSSTFRLFKK